MIDVFVLASFQLIFNGLRGLDTTTVEETEESEGSESPYSFEAIIQTTI